MSGTAWVDITLGQAWHRAGDPNRARDRWRRAHAMLSDAGSTHAADVAALLASVSAPRAG